MNLVLFHQPRITGERMKLLWLDGGWEKVSHYLGVFSGRQEDYGTFGGRPGAGGLYGGKKNWEDSLEQVKGRLENWKWLQRCPSEVGH